MDMRIKVLGCSGAAFPGHHLPGFLLDGRILFDAGSLTNVLDVRTQLKIEHIFITHAHLDHIIGIPFLADNIIIRDIPHQVNILSIPPVIRTIKRDLLNSSVWPDFTAIPNIQNSILSLVELKTGQSVKIHDYTITPYKVNHSVPAVGYLVENKRGRRLFYTGDTGPSQVPWKRLSKGQIHCLIIEVSFPNRMEEIALKAGHLTPKLLKRELSKMKPIPERIYVTHLKPQFFKVIKKELQKLKIKNIRLLRDGETIRV
jgi:ribonuclease BN (tRNA processing enzyme)